MIVSVGLHSKDFTPVVLLKFSTIWWNKYE